MNVVPPKGACACEQPRGEENHPAVHKCDPLEFSMSTATVTASSTILPHDPASAQLFRNEFDRTAFAFSQSLHNLECFRYEALLDIAKRFEARQSGFHVEEEDTTPGEGWSSDGARKPLVEN